jgi:hypothetical protein
MEDIQVSKGTVLNTDLTPMKAAWLNLLHIQMVSSLLFSFPQE